jgi:hypothetical protein
MIAQVVKEGTENSVAFPWFSTSINFASAPSSAAVRQQVQPGLFAVPEEARDHGAGSIQPHQALVIAKFCAHARRRCTYPGLLPLLHLDHIYYEGRVDIAGVEIPRTRNRSVDRT